MAEQTEQCEATVEHDGALIRCEQPPGHGGPHTAGDVTWTANHPPAE